MLSSLRRAVTLALALAVAGSFPPAAGGQTWTAPKPTDKVEDGVNWTMHVIQAKAIGVAPPNAQSPEHGRALAITAGTVLARQELLALARGVTIDSRTTVQALMVANAVTDARVSVVIRGAQVVGTRDLGATDCPTHSPLGHCVCHHQRLNGRAGVDGH